MHNGGRRREGPPTQFRMPRHRQEAGCVGGTVGGTMARREGRRAGWYARAAGGGMQFWAPSGRVSGARAAALACLPLVRVPRAGQRCVGGLGRCAGGLGVVRRRLRVIQSTAGRSAIARDGIQRAPWAPMRSTGWGKGRRRTVLTPCYSPSSPCAALVSTGRLCCAHRRCRCRVAGDALAWSGVAAARCRRRRGCGGRERVLCVGAA